MSQSSQSNLPNDRNSLQNDPLLNSMSPQEISEQMKEIYLMDYDWKQSSSERQIDSALDSFSTKDISNTIPAPSFYSALCIVPPDDAWDMIQRARHLAKDHTFYRWPPVIRLFHPFAPRPYLASAASAIAELIEKHQIEPFEITLDKLVIRPHWEAFERINELENNDVNKEKYEENVDEEKLSDIQKLILNEERKGKERYNKRMKKMQQTSNTKKLNQTQEDIKANEQAKTANKDKKGKKKQTRKKETTNENNLKEYNGPCVVCLEPNKESKIKLQKLRKLLKDELFDPYDSFSFSSALSTADTPFLPESITIPVNESLSFFEPTITLGSFPTKDSAAKVAKNLQSMWEPLSFSVGDIHLVSRDESSQTDDHTNDLSTFCTDQYVCDAMIMLVGEEIEEDVNSDALLSLLFEAGEDGGGAANLQYNEISAEDKRWMEERKAMLQSMLEIDDDDDDDNEGLEVEFEDFEELDELDYSDDIDEFWFDDEDEDDDQGATIIIGRTQFFLGEMRLYVGMPAYNPMDSNGRLLGQGISGVDRRKGTKYKKGLQ